MSTRSYICRKNGKKLDYIYAHWGGYFDDNGRKLYEHYNTDEKVNALIDSGDISSLGIRLHPIDPANHDFYKPEKGTTVIYKRDRNDPEDDKNVDFRTVENFDDLFDRAKRSYIEYIYVWNGKYWKGYDVYGAEGFGYEGKKGLKLDEVIPVIDQCNKGEYREGLIIYRKLKRDGIIK